MPLCPQSHTGYLVPSKCSADEKVDMLLARANSCLREGIRRRAEQFVVDDDEPTTPTREADVHPFIPRLNKRWHLLSRDQIRMISSLDHPFPTKLLPLDQCILDIFWEISDCPLSRIIIGSAGDLIMLRAAAMYQAKSETVSYLPYPSTLTNTRVGSANCPIIDLFTKLPGGIASRELWQSGRNLTSSL